MNQIEVYTLLFTDSLVSNLVISLDRELIFHTMKVFGDHNKVAIVLTSTTASIFANCINYFLGRVLFNFFYLTKNNVGNRVYDAYSQFIARYYVFVLMLSIIPFWGKFIILLTGFTKVNFFRVIGISGLMKLCYYTVLL